MGSSAIDVSIVISFHREGLLAHSTLNSVHRCRKYAQETGLRTESIWVLDSVDEETRRVVTSHPTAAEDMRFVEVSHRDPGATRNSGVATARGQVVAILDGDDYYSENWIERGFYFLSLFGDHCIVHPEFVIGFGVEKVWGRMVDPGKNGLERGGLLVENYWPRWSMASREIYEQTPYVTTRPAITGFGHEDWHWNCETIAKGIEHRLAIGTVGFRRRKLTGGWRNASMENASLPPTELFAPPLVKEAAT
jgi:glycosyltransferase involved in cell wall biosynthesis